MPKLPPTKKLPMKLPTRKRLIRTRPSRPMLRFHPAAWAKLLFLRDLGETEVGGFGISAADDLLLIEDFVLVRQHCSVITVAFRTSQSPSSLISRLIAGCVPSSLAGSGFTPIRASRPSRVPSMRKRSPACSGAATGP